MEAVKRVCGRARWFLKDNGAGEQCNGGDVGQVCGESLLEVIGQLWTSECIEDVDSSRQLCQSCVDCIVSGVLVVDTGK